MPRADHGFTCATRSGGVGRRDGDVTNAGRSVTAVDSATRALSMPVEDAVRAHRLREVRCSKLTTLISPGRSSAVEVSLPEGLDLCSLGSTLEAAAGTEATPVTVGNPVPADVYAEICQLKGNYVTATDSLPFPGSEDRARALLAPTTPTMLRARPATMSPHPTSWCTDPTSCSRPFGPVWRPSAPRNTTSV